jgi:RNA polymerase sigma factor (sigma-70 family)
MSAGGAGADVTGLLAAWGAGDRAALDALLPLVYDELRRQARSALRARGPGTRSSPRRSSTRRTSASPTAVPARGAAAASSSASRRAACGRCSSTPPAPARRPSGAAARMRSRSATPTPWPAGAAGGEVAGVDVLALDAALERLAALDPDQARLVELRYFAGLTIDDTAAALGVSPATVSREWSVARRWLRRALEAERG